MDLPTGPTSSRKKDHVDLTINRDVAFRQKSTGFEKWEFVHNALPEIDFKDISTSAVFAGRALSFPFMVSCMTGGYPDAERINREFAEVCEDARIAMGVGSQRQAIENTAYHSSFSIVRTAAPSIPIVGNIGASEVARMTDASTIQRLASLIGADAFAIHLNPLQEFLQPEGSTNFSGVLRGIEMLVRRLEIPLIVKEIGAGISVDVARRLLDAGVTIIDVAGAGGTSWAGVEILRSAAGSNAPEHVQHPVDDYNDVFWDWGIPTADAIEDLARLKKSSPMLRLIASGGISNGLECAKALALGADMTASARPMLKQLMNEGQQGLQKMIEGWIRQCKGAMFLTGASTITALQNVAMNHISR
ncbi:MAG TPA: type 2 isopentenyl-diphosphate Delta-isomerase [Bacteroidota bacterium]|nr:type 2 isopentenyl-diphosphate Delta-isomerase [Bacteroidota bacterium]